MDCFRAVLFVGLLAFTAVAPAENESSELLVAHHHCYAAFQQLIRQNAEHIRRQAERSFDHLKRNFRAAIRPGVVTAAASDNNPHYQFVWRRDSGLVVDPIVKLYDLNPEAFHDLRIYLDGYVQEVMARSKYPGKSGLSGVKYTAAENVAFSDLHEADGSAKSWMEPQHDGPAIEANTILRFLRTLIRKGVNPAEIGRVLAIERDVTPKGLFENSIVKLHADHILGVWNQKGYDVWETVLGRHFHTAMVQRKALLEAADLAIWMGDPNSATTYRNASQDLERLIDRFWDQNRGTFLANIDVELSLDPDKFIWDQGNAYPKSGLDVSILLGVLHGYTEDNYIKATDDRLIATGHALEQGFIRLFPVNRKNDLVGVAIGRFFEDHYDGHQNSKESRAHAWVLATAAYAEWHYKMAQEYEASEIIHITARSHAYYQTLVPSYTFVVGEVINNRNPMFDSIVEQTVAKGDSYMTRIISHMDLDGSLAEQIDGNDGYMRGAGSLNWSYAAVTTAATERQAWLNRRR